MEYWPFTPTLKVTGLSNWWAICVWFTDHYDMLIATFCMQHEHYFSANIIHLFVNNYKLSIFDKTVKNLYILRHSVLSSWVILYRSTEILMVVWTPGSSCAYFLLCAPKLLVILRQLFAMKEYNGWKNQYLEGPHLLLSHNYKNHNLPIYPFYCEWEKLSESFRCLSVF